jgi:phosphoglycerate dehydrogenase-like enzyme
MAEHTLGMIIDLAKDISQRSWKLKGGVADFSDSLFLKGKTLGVIGAGGIGQAVAKLAKCLGMKTLGVNTSGRRAPHFDKVYTDTRMDDVLKGSDVIVVTLPLTVSTFHLINAGKLEMMKQNCILINVGRGYVIDEEALYYHLKSHSKFKCGLDVWWHYPKPSEPFVQKFPFSELPNFLGTPHVSGFVPEEKLIALDFAIDNIVRYVHGKKLLGLASRGDYLGLHGMIASSKTS